MGLGPLWNCRIGIVAILPIACKIDHDPRNREAQFVKHMVKFYVHDVSLMLQASAFSKIFCALAQNPVFNFFDECFVPVFKK
jgi:hypothetical protein